MNKISSKPGNRELDDRVLIVDDDKVALFYLSDIVEGMGLRPLKSARAGDALEVFRKYTPPVVLLDYKLPDMTGEEVLRKIKSLSPASQVIIITGFGKYDLAVKLINGGASDYLKKPFDEEVLVESIKRARDTYRQIHSGITPLSIMVADEEDDVAAAIEKARPDPAWSVFHVRRREEAERLLGKVPVDIIIASADFCGPGHGIECLKEIKKMPLTCEVIIAARKGTEGTAMEALRNGAANYIRVPEDLGSVTGIIEKLSNSLNLKRIFRLKTRELKDAQAITARINDFRKIELSLFSGNSKISSSFALRFLDNIPVGIAVMDSDLRVIYSNRFLRKNCPEPPEKLGPEIISAIKGAGIDDVTLEVIKEEARKLLNPEEDIETVTIGKKEYLTLTNLKLIDSSGPRETLLLIHRCG